MAQKGANNAAKSAQKIFDGRLHGGAFSGQVDMFNGIRINIDHL